MAGYVIPKLRQKTIERYQGLIDKHLVPYIGHVELTKLIPIDVATLEAKLLDNGMAPKGVEMVHNVISGAYKYAVSMEVAWRNPVKSVTPPKVIRKEVEPPEIAKVRGILSLAEAEEHPLFACFHLIAYTGLRRGEAIGLRHQDLNLEAGASRLFRPSVARSTRA